jgi:phosphohistidine swiveling domain-containing protein
VDDTRARRLLSLANGLGQRLVADGILGHPQQLWRLTEEELGRAVRQGVRPPTRLGPSRWDPFVYGVVQDAGCDLRGVPTVPGIGVGRPCLVGPTRSWAAPAPRQVLAVRSPLPHLAPMLWGSAGLVSEHGSTGAHLFEVARSLGVPAITGVRLPSDLGEEPLVAVDGAAGSVWVLPEGRG